MAECIPKRVDEAGVEDVQDIQRDISALAQKYIVPVDRIKSIAKPDVSAGTSADGGFKNLNPNNTRRVESRAHAFLRFIGFPVVAGTAAPTEFYNPGFDPTGEFIGTLAGQATTKRNVLAKFNNDSALKSMVEKREQDPIDLRRIFARRDTTSSIYALVLRHVRNFKMFDAGDPFAEIQQDAKNDNRVEEANAFFAANENIDQSSITSPLVNTTVGTTLSGVRHILHPFVVDPRVDNTVMPDRSQIAVPFLKSKEELKLEKDIYVLRPGIELIIRERLRDTANDADVFFQNVEKLLNNDQSPLPDVEVRTENELRLTVEALLDNNEISQSAINSDIKGITSIQVQNIRRLVKTIRSVVVSLKDSLLVIDDARQKINWVPIPSQEGPEKGSQDAILNQQDTANSTDIDKRVLELRIKKLNAERRVAEESDLGDFASPFNSSVNDDNIRLIDDELRSLIAERDKIADDAFKAMGDVEIISGEVSGLGLLDILAIYTALWAVEEKALVSLLDDQSFSRLKNFFPTLLVGAAADRDSSGDKYDIQTALEKFEKKLVNVLAFIDREIERQDVAPGEESSGSVSADS